jgi:hypothetical protein
MRKHRTDSGTTADSLPEKSVFENEYDFTDIHPDKRAEALDRRWKFTGPWLAGMSPGEFNEWLAREVRPKRPQFREFLKKKIASEMHGTLARAALDKAESPPPPIDPNSVTDDQLIDYVRKLRHNNQALYDMVGQFLDLAPLKPPTTAQMGLPSQSTRMEYPEVSNPWAEHGPPITHPSAGISYLRSSMYMENHPIYGPQKQHSPVVARIVRPRRQAQAVAAKLGLAGFIVDTPLGDTAANSKSASKEIYDRIDPSVVGGAKVWVQAQKARVDSKGRVILTVGDASAEAALVAQELLGNATCLGAPRGESEVSRRETTAGSLRARYRAAGAPPMSSAQDYGLLQ